MKKKTGLPVKTGNDANMAALGEFWQGGAHRLHDRFLYQREGSLWHIDRLAP